MHIIRTSSPFIPGYHRQPRQFRVDRMVQWDRIPQGTAVLFRDPPRRRWPKRVRKAQRYYSTARRAYFNGDGNMRILPEWLRRSAALAAAKGVDA